MTFGKNTEETLQLIIEFYKKFCFVCQNSLKKMFIILLFSQSKKGKKKLKHLVRWILPKPKHCLKYFPPSVSLTAEIPCLERTLSGSCLPLRIPGSALRECHTQRGEWKEGCGPHSCLLTPHTQGKSQLLPVERQLGVDPEPVQTSLNRPCKPSAEANQSCKASHWAGGLSLNYAKDALAGASGQRRSSPTSDLVIGGWVLEAILLSFG